MTGENIDFVRPPDFIRAITDAALSLIAALANAECLRQKATIDHDDFERLVTFVNEAAQTLQVANRACQNSTTTIYPCLEAARAALAKLPQDGDLTYRISRDGVGRCSIEVYRLTERL